MSLDQREIGKLVAIVRGFVKDLQSPVAIVDQSTFLPTLSDFANTSQSGMTRAQMAALVNRYYAEQITSSRPIALSET